MTPPYSLNVKTRRPVNIKSIAIIQTAFLGDVILATALVESLNQKFPKSNIDFLVRNGNEGVLLGNPKIRKLFVFNKKRKLRSIFLLVKCFRKNKYDLIINVQRFASTGLLTILSGAKTTVGFKKNPLSPFFTYRMNHKLGGEHEINRNHALIAPWVGNKVSMPKLYPSHQDENRVEEIIKQEYYTISPASVWATKQFPMNKWIELLGHLHKESSIYILGSKADTELSLEIIRNSTNTSVVSMTGKLSILESAHLMKGAIMNFVNDSAPLHIASAINAPVTVVFCSTIPKFGFGPLSEKKFIVETKEKLACRPCGLHGYRKCPKTHFKCAQSISIQQLLVE